MDWVHDCDSEGILWLSGAAGTGKSSIANSVAQQLYSLGRLGASFRFDRDAVTSETPGHLFGNLSYQLACFDDQLRVAVLAAIHSGCGGAMSCRMQARTLLVEPIQQTEIVGPLVIVIDAMDESGSDDGNVGTSRKTLVHAIVQEFSALPQSIKVLITSRDEGSISQLMPKCASCLHKDTIDVKGTEEDIYTFIHYRMGQIQSSNPGLPSWWPGTTRERQLAHYADGLFIWADVACTFIESGDDPDVQLDELFNDEERVTAEAKLDQLFVGVISHSLNIDQIIRVNNWHYVVDTIVALKAPLTNSGIDSLLGLSMGQSSKTLLDGRQIKLTTSSTIISSLRPILRLDSGTGGGVVRLLDKSVFDYLTTRAKEPIWVNVSAQDGILALQCLEIMNHNLHYNICNIGNKSLLNSEVEGLAGCVNRCIPEALHYACLYFVDHLKDSLTSQPALERELYQFIAHNLLHWMEVMSLLKQVYQAEVCLKILSDCVQVYFVLWSQYIYAYTYAEKCGWSS
jgi:ATPase family associated with various cellular activities (AAA)